MRNLIQMINFAKLYGTSRKMERQQNHSKQETSGQSAATRPVADSLCFEQSTGWWTRLCPVLPAWTCYLLSSKCEKAMSHNHGRWVCMSISAWSCWLIFKFEYLNPRSIWLIIHGILFRDAVEPKRRSAWGSPAPGHCHARARDVWTPIPSLVLSVFAFFMVFIWCFHAMWNISQYASTVRSIHLFTNLNSPVPLAYLWSKWLNGFDNAHSNQTMRKVTPLMVGSNASSRLYHEHTKNDG